MVHASISRTELEELSRKYEAMLQLRRNEVTAPQTTLAALARRFPGSLRELDDLPLDVLETRARAAAQAAEDPSAVEPWMVACGCFHRLMRGALAAKRWLSTTAGPTESSFRRAIDEGLLGEDAVAWADHWEHVTRPPGGRMSDAAFDRVGLAMGIARHEAKLLVFGRLRRAP